MIMAKLKWSSQQFYPIPEGKRVAFKHCCRVTTLKHYVRWIALRTVLSHLVHDDFTLSRFGHVDHSLDDVVCILVLHHGVQGAVGPVFLTAHLVYEQSPLGTWRMDHTFFHNITGGEKNSSAQWFVTLTCTIYSIDSQSNIVTSLPCKFVLAEDKNFSTDLGNYFAFILWSTMFQHMLNHVVAILILQRAAEDELRGSGRSKPIVHRRSDTFWFSCINWYRWS